MNLRVASTAKRTLGFFMHHFATSVATSSSVESLKPCRPAGIRNASVANCARRNWPIPALFATITELCVMVVMQVSKLRRLASTRAKSVMDSSMALRCDSAVKFITVIISIAPAAALN